MNIFKLFRKEDRKRNSDKDFKFLLIIITHERMRLTKVNKDI